MSTKLIYNARLAGEANADAWVLIEGQRIKEVGHGELPDVEAERHDAGGLLLMPGAIDCHVHFREPGMEHKADIASESRAALAGGVTSIIDMPNNKPATVGIAEWEDKMRRAAEKSCVNYAFFIGATNDNLDVLRNADYTQIPGVKLFVGSSTGNMLVTDKDLMEEIFTSVPAIVAVHAEHQQSIESATEYIRSNFAKGEIPLYAHNLIRTSEACFVASALMNAISLRHNHRLHICHITTQFELNLLQTHIPLEHRRVTSEVSPHHLIFSDRDYDRLGTRIKMNPAVKTPEDREALREALRNGDIDMVATDHAPHLLKEKEGDALTAVSGAPGVQFSLILMLDLFDEALVQRVMCENPAKVYGIIDRGQLRPGAYADLVLVDCDAPHTITDADVLSKCGWTPYAGMQTRHAVRHVWLNGSHAFPSAQPPRGLPLRFTPHYIPS